MSDDDSLNDSDVDFVGQGSKEVKELKAKDNKSNAKDSKSKAPKKASPAAPRVAATKGKKRQIPDNESEEDSNGDGDSSDGDDDDDDDDFDEDDEVQLVLPPAAKKAADTPKSKAKGKASSSSSSSKDKAGSNKKARLLEPQKEKAEEMDVEDDGSIIDSPPPSKASAPTSGKKKAPSSKSSSSSSSSSKEAGLAAPAKAISSSSSSSSSAGQPLTVIDVTKGGEVGTEQQASKLLTTYFLQQNRPYVINQLFDNFHKRIPKSIIERVLDGPVRLEKLGLACKEFNKVKLFYPDQSKLQSNASPADLKLLEGRARELEQECSDLQQQEKMLIFTARKLTNQPTDDKLDEEIEIVEARVKEKQSRAQKISSVPADPDALAKTVKAFNFYRNGWATRKRITMDLVKDIATSMEKKLAVILADIGIETDEENSCVLPPVMPDVK